MTSGLPTSPVVVEVPTWPWLTELSRRLGHDVTLADVPGDVWDDLVLRDASPSGSRGCVDAVWLMGVWERSPVGRAIALADEHLRAACLAVLPDCTDDDIVGSPYCVHRYVVDEHLGGPPGLAAARASLAERGVRLIVDFVPNHVALDHPWVSDQPDFFVRATPDDVAREPGAFVETVHGPIAFGRDPYFAPWSDVAQLDTTKQIVRDALIATLIDIAAQADGVRCDMAMLLLDDVVVRTWAGRVGLPPPRPFWVDAISRVHEAHPLFAFLAEAYWDREPDLIAQGFDHCYDKRLTDRLLHEDAASVRAHLVADPGYQSHLVRFLENHDEARVASVVDPARNRAASVVVATLPGALLLFDRQEAGWRARAPVQLGRRPIEPDDTDLAGFWRHLLSVVAADALRLGTWQTRAVEGWADNQSCDRIVAWEWRAGPARHLVVVNLSDRPAAGRVSVPDLDPGQVTLTDRLTAVAYERAGDELMTSGLFVSLEGWAAHLLAFSGHGAGPAQVLVNSADGSR